MEIHKNCDHKNIVKVQECGEDGKILKPNGSTVTGLYYIIMEYIPAGMLYDVFTHFDGVGEIVAKFFTK